MSALSQIQNSCAEFLRNETPSPSNLQATSVQQEISNLNLSEINFFLNEFLPSYFSHRKLLISMYSWDFFDRLYSLFQVDSSIVEADLKNLQAGLRAIFAYVSTKELELMVLEKCSFASTFREYLFIVVSVENLFHSSNRVSIDGAVKSFSFVLSKLDELTQTEELRSVEQHDLVFQVLLEACNSINRPITRSVQEGSVSGDLYPTKIKSILIGFLFQLISKGITVIPSREVRERLSLAILENLLSLFNQPDLPTFLCLLFSYIRHEQFSAWNYLKHQRREKKFLKQLASKSGNEKALTSLENLFLFKALDKATTSTILSFVNSLHENHFIDTNNTIFFLSEDIVEEMQRETRDEEFYAISSFDLDEETGRPVLFISRHFPWPLTSVSYLISFILLSAQSSISPLSLVPSSPVYSSSLLDAAVPYLFNLPALTSQEALLSFVLEFDLIDPEKDHPRQFFLPVWANIAPPPTNPSQLQSQSSSPREVIEHLLDDKVLLISSWKQFAGFKDNNDRTMKNLWRVAMDSFFHWKFSQSIIVSLVSCANDQLREKSFFAFKKYLQTFESRSRFLLLSNLIDHCPYPQMKALLVDIVKSQVQSTIQAIQQNHPDHVPHRSHLYQHHPSSLSLTSQRVDWPKLIDTSLSLLTTSIHFENLQDFLNWKENFLKINQNDHQDIQQLPLVFSTDYSTMIIHHQQQSIENIEREIYSLTATGSGKGIFWSSFLFRRLFFLPSSSSSANDNNSNHQHHQDDINKLEYDQLMELGEYFNAKINLLLFLLMKLETSLESYFFFFAHHHFQQHSSSSSTQERDFLMIWSLFWSIEDVNPSNNDYQTISGDWMDSAVRMLSDIFIYFHHWLQQFRKIKQQNQEEQQGHGHGHGHHHPHPFELLKLDILQTNMHRCLLKLQIILCQLYFISRH